MSERIGLLDDVSVQTKPTRIPFVCYEEILMCLFVLEYATLAINLSLLQHSHSNSIRSTEKNRFLVRKSDSYSPFISKSARSRHYYLAKSARSRHYYRASDHTIHRAFNRALLKKNECC